MPAAIAMGSANAWAAPAIPIGDTKTKATSIAAARPSIRRHRGARDAVREHDVEREERAVRKRECEPKSLDRPNWIWVSRKTPATARAPRRRSEPCAPLRSPARSARRTRSPRRSRAAGGRSRCRSTHSSRRRPHRGRRRAARPSRSSRAIVRQGRRQSANTRAAEAIRSHATPSTSTRAKSRTANDGPR